MVLNLLPTCYLTSGRPLPLSGLPFPQWLKWEPWVQALFSSLMPTSKKANIISVPWGGGMGWPPMLGSRWGSLRARNFLWAKPKAGFPGSQRTLGGRALTVSVGYGFQMGNSNGVSRKRSLAITKSPASTQRKLMEFATRHAFYKQRRNNNHCPKATDGV